MTAHPLLAALETSIRFPLQTYRHSAGLEAELEAGTLGDVASSVWATEAPAGDDYAFQTGHRYAVLASVSLNYTLAQIVAKMTSLGFVVTYAWEEGTPTRGLYEIDAWIASLPADTTSNHRWVYGEADFAGASTTLAVDAPWPLTIYHVAQVFEAVAAPPAGTPPPALPPPAAEQSAPAASGPSAVEVLAIAGAGVGVLALGWWAAERFL